MICFLQNNCKNVIQINLRNHKDSLPNILIEQTTSLLNINLFYEYKCVLKSKNRSEAKKLHHAKNKFIRRLK